MSPDPQTRLQRFKLLLQRFFLLLLIYMIFLHFAVLTVFKVIEYVRVSRELATENAEYSRQFHQYSQALWESERLRQDKSYQFQVVKGSHYYTERDEELVLIVEQ